MSSRCSYDTCLATPLAGTGDVVRGGQNVVPLVIRSAGNPLVQTCSADNMIPSHPETGRAGLSMVGRRTSWRTTCRVEKCRMY